MVVNSSRRLREERDIITSSILYVHKLSIDCHVYKIHFSSMTKIVYSTVRHEVILPIFMNLSSSLLIKTGKCISDDILWISAWIHRSGTVMYSMSPYKDKSPSEVGEVVCQISLARLGAF